MSLTASALDRIYFCPASETLEHCREITSDSDAGVSNHSFLADAVEFGHEAALAKAPEDLRPTFAAIDFEALGLQPGAFSAEVAYLYDCRDDTAREIGRNIDRGYEAVLGRPLEPWEVAGTGDAIAVNIQGKHGVVIDWKSGWANDHVPPARINRQVRFLGLAIARTYGLESVTVCIVCVRPYGKPYFDKAELGFFDIEEVAEEVRALANNAVEVAADQARSLVTPRFTIGSWCKYCPGRRSCPGQLAMVTSLANGEAQVQFRIDAATPPEVVGSAYEKLIAAERMIKVLKEACKGYAETASDPVPTPSGKVLARVTVKGKPKYDSDAAHGYLLNAFGQTVADKAMKKATDMAKIGRALKGYCEEKRMKITKVTDDVKTHLIRIGAITRSLRQDVRLVAADSPRIIEDAEEEK